MSEENRQQSAAILQLLLANEYVLYTKTLKYHWNVVGKHFGPLHKLFEQHYEQFQVIIDDVAERIRALDIMTQTTLVEFIAQATIKEEPNATLNDVAMLKQLTHDHEIIIRQLRKGVDGAHTANDAGTNNFLSELLEQHEKMAWMLRAHLE